MAATSHSRLRPIRGALAAAACAAVGTVLGGAQAGLARDIEIDSAILMYSEPNRVSAAEAVVAARTFFSGDRAVNFKIVYDALTGASANGAVPGSTTQTFTRASGRGGYQVPSGETPLDDTFRDVRVALSGGYTFPLGRLNKANLGFYGSSEHDYASLGGNASLARDFFKRNTTLSAGISISHDTVHPEGGRPDPFSAMIPPGFLKSTLSGDGTKNVSDFIMGLTQVLNRSTLVQLNYSLSDVSGYQTDPYKFVSLVDPQNGSPVAQLYENRPENRAKHIFMGRLKRHLSRDVVDFSYRYMTDDWGIRSHTADLKYRLELGNGRYIQPHLRYYRQTAADFYTRWLEGGSTRPDFATADYRLGPLRTWTLGLQHGRILDNGHRLTMRLEYYRQSGTPPPNAPGDLAGFELFPSVSAVFAQIGYSLGI